ncbi:MAG TPA: manganese efflux pump [Kofleriaceae bacterium]|jgi:putative Mn2+ efflux pump MntP
MWRALALSFGLAMDASAVSAARGLAGRNRRELAILPLVFGGFQAGMSALGWIGGDWAAAHLGDWASWIAFGLLVLIGLKMVVDAWRAGDADNAEHGTIALYLGLGVATSIDAAVAGLTLPLVPIAPWQSIALIGAITAVCSVAGYALGRALGGKVGGKLGYLGGIALIALGASMLIR